MILYGPAGTGKTSSRAHHRRGHPGPLRGGLGGHRRRRRAAQGDRGGERPARPDGPAHDPVHRRDPPLLQVAAGRAAARGRGPDRRPGRRDHREPVLRGERAADQPVARRRAGAARPTRTSARSCAGRSPTSAGLAGRFSSTPHAEDAIVLTAGGDARVALTTLELAVAMVSRRRRGCGGRRSRWTRCARRHRRASCPTTRRATSTTT